ncbi:MAG TPA: hypothetical protein VEH57_00910 [Thermoplasmata archaeon]|nr:hypothetical protein [Thermoplasmata archaeon]
MPPSGPPKAIPRALVRTFATVAADRAHGAGSLALRTARALRANLPNLWTGNVDARPRQAKAIAEELSRLQPAMGAFREWSRVWAEAARKVKARDLPRWSDRWVQTTLRRLHAEPRRILSHVRPGALAGKRVLTLSRSEAVERTLLSLSDGHRPSEVMVLWSEPGGEGWGLARSLARRGLPVRLLPDRAAASAVRECDLLLIGADAVYGDGSVVHKVGTRRIASLAATRRCPVVVVTGTSKWVGRRPAPRHLPPLFDLTPARCVSEYWTDRGRRKGRGVSLRS